MRLQLQNICHLLCTTRAHLNENKREAFGARHLTVRKTTAAAMPPDMRSDMLDVKRSTIGYYFLVMTQYTHLNPNLSGCMTFNCFNFSVS